jgi:hypothetical protein
LTLDLCGKAKTADVYTFETASSRKEIRMEERISHRSFLKTSATALGAVAICDFKGIAGAARRQLEYMKTLNMGNDQYELITL